MSGKDKREIFGPGNNRSPAAQMRNLGKRLEGGLHPTSKAAALSKAMESFAEIIQREAPEPTSLKEYQDVFDLTQVAAFGEWQQRMLEAPGVIHPAHRVLACIIQLESADLQLQALLGFLWNSRRTVAQAQDNLKGFLYQLIEAMENEVSVVRGRDRHGREFQAFTAATAPSSVVIRRSRPQNRKKKVVRRDKRARERRANRGARKD